jgi:uncharacterized protein YbjT (DUF2867 family)
VSKPRVAVLGATGYVGGRLVPRLLKRGYAVVAISRSASKLRSRPWATHPDVELRSADVLQVESLAKALEGCCWAYYLVHSMDGQSRDFAEADRRAAANLVQVSAGLERIIYLGGLGLEGPKLSKHLRSRAEVASILQQGTVPVTVFRAAMIIGSGSASFEMLRYLVDRLVIMLTPSWVSTPSQPIGIRNVLNYLIACLEYPETVGQTYDIGGPDVVTYRQLMQIYAEEAGFKRRYIISIPLFSPWLSSSWISLVTPVQASIARPLVEGLKNPTVCSETRIREIIPQELLSCREAIRRALRLHLKHHIETHWTDAGFLPPEEAVYHGDPNWSGGTVYTDRRFIVIEGNPEELWTAVVRIGGETGWYYGNALWRLRGLMDRLMGGVGDSRGRRDPDEVLAGDALDFWRVLAVIPNQRLRLLAEMKVPGQAILDFHVEKIDDHHVKLVQTAWFVPRGLLGLAYWFAVSPLHNFVFDGMLRGIAKAAHVPIKEGPSRVL